MFKNKNITILLVIAVIVIIVGILLFPGVQNSIKTVFKGGKATGPVKLTVWGRDLPNDDPAHAYIRAVVTGFRAENPDIELEYIALGDPGLMDKTKVAMASNKDLPDIFQGWGGSVMGGYADAGRLLDMTKELKSIPCSAAAREAMTWKKKIYGVAPFFAIAGLFINEDIFKANGLKIPTTIDELEAVADALKAKGIQPFACGARDKWPPLALYMYLTDRYGGINAFDDARTRKIRFDSDAFVQAAQKYQEWVKKGYFGEKPLSEAYGDADNLMATGKAAMQVTGSWKCAQYASKDFTDQNIGFYPFPVLPGGKGEITDMMGMVDIGFTVTKAAANKKDAVVRFLKYAMSVEACSAEKGRICAVPGVKVPTRLTGMASEVFGKAKAIQFWWDQDLPPMITSPLNDTLQTFFMPESDVVRALTKYEELAEEHLGPAKEI
ncbi:MAG: extracellular solute-binding protein [Firmicutes bacterium]|nr:extracellular solute-binding protein [Bacillota bacterium]